MIQLMVFDLDSTLAPIGFGMGEEELELFRKLENTGVRIAICSGKTCDYLCGFMRQIGLKNPVLIGENGAVIRFGIDLPPKRHYRVPFSREATDSLKKNTTGIGGKNSAYVVSTQQNRGDAFSYVGRRIREDRSGSGRIQKVM